MKNNSDDTIIADLVKGATISDYTVMQVCVSEE